MSSVDDLVAWLRQQLDDDERVAQRAASLCGCHPPSPRWLFGDESTDGRILVADDPHPDIPRRLNRRWNRSYDGLFAAGHIARHDPARVLAEVDAKRRVLDEHQPNGGACRTCCGEAYMEETWNGEEEQITWKRADKPWPCPTFRLLALPYADRPGYRDEWRPA